MLGDSVIVCSRNVGFGNHGWEFMHLGLGFVGILGKINAVYFWNSMVESPGSEAVRLGLGSGGFSMKQMLQIPGI